MVYMNTIREDESRRIVFLNYFFPKENKKASKFLLSIPEFLFLNKFIDEKEKIMIGLFFRVIIYPKSTFVQLLPLI